MPPWGLKIIIAPATVQGNTVCCVEYQARGIQDELGKKISDISTLS